MRKHKIENNGTKYMYLKYTYPPFIKIVKKKIKVFNNAQDTYIPSLKENGQRKVDGT